MPTVLRVGGLRVVIYPNDHAPRLVHVIGVQEAKFALEPAVTLIENYGFRSKDILDISAKLTAERIHLISEWDRIHGT